MAHPVFEKSLSKLVIPALEQHGFVFNGRRDFIKPYGQSEAKINFQLGQRGMAGKFTVNLIVDGASERLGCVRKTKWSRTIDLVFGNYNPWWKDVFMPKDKWWKLDEFDSYMNRTMNRVLFILVTDGMAWLEENVNQ